jgi:cell division protein FtsL
VGLLRNRSNGSVGDPKEALQRRRIVTLLILDVTLGLALVWLRVMVQDIGYRLDNTAKLIEKLDLEYAELVADTSQETSPDRLRKLAETDLKLHVPQPGQVLTSDAQP